MKIVFGVNVNDFNISNDTIINELEDMNAALYKPFKLYKIEIQRNKLWLDVDKNTDREALSDFINQCILSLKVRY